MPIIKNLFFKKDKGAPMIIASTISLEKGYGIEHDINASAISPRQILITRKEDLDEMNIKYGGLRENIILEGINENDFIPGALIQLGDHAKVRLTFYCEPCKRIADVVPSLKSIINKRGILGVVIEGGKVNINDFASAHPKEFLPFSEEPYQRFLNFIQYIPQGKVVTYKMIATGMGVAESYIRAMPKYIHRCQTEKRSLPVHRIVDTSGAVIDNYVPQQVALLQHEKVHVIAALDLFDNEECKVSLSKFLWHGESLYLSQ